MKNTIIWKLLTCLTAGLAVVMAVALFSTYRQAGEWKKQLEEVQNRLILQETQQAVEQEEVLSVRIQNGMLQRLNKNQEWEDVAAVEELLQSDPTFVENAEVQELLGELREALKNGTIKKEEISVMLAKQNAATDSSASKPSEEQKTETDKSNPPDKKPISGATNTKPTTPASTAKPTVTPQPTAKPEEKTDSRDEEREEADDEDSDDDSRDDDGAGEEAGDDDNSGDTGSSDDENAGGEDGGDDSSTDGDGEDVGWTDEIL